jgi:hypothetical protein
VAAVFDDEYAVCVGGGAAVVGAIHCTLIRHAKKLAWKRYKK